MLQSPRSFLNLSAASRLTSQRSIGVSGASARFFIPKYSHLSFSQTTTTTRSLVSRFETLLKARNKVITIKSYTNGSRLFKHNLYHHVQSSRCNSNISLRSWNVQTLRVVPSRITLTNFSRSASNASTVPNRSRWWSRFAIVLRYVRIPVLIISVYSLGYQQGIIDCIKEPIALQNQILNGILISTGCTSIEDVNVIDDKDIKFHSFRRPDQVAIVGHKIIAAARNIIETKLQDAMMKVKSTLPNDISPENELLAMSSDPDVEFYYNARLRINGEQVENAMWQYIFVKSSTPNAFVTEILPRKFFITTAMLQVATTPDELAVVLGHEISHLILGHVSSTNKVETFLRTIEVLLLSMDPTAGLLSVFVIGTIFAARQLVSAAYSRENEIQADDLGLEIAAAACYDTVAGCKVMYKMHQVSNGTSPLSAIGSHKPNVRDTETLDTPSSSSSSSAIARLMDTHPPSLDRYERMLVAAQNGENYTKYVNCANISRRLFNVLWGTKTKDDEKDAIETKNKSSNFPNSSTTFESCLTSIRGTTTMDVHTRQKSEMVVVASTMMNHPHQLQLLPYRLQHEPIILPLSLTIRRRFLPFGVVTQIVLLFLVVIFIRVEQAETLEQDVDVTIDINGDENGRFEMSDDATSSIDPNNFMTDNDRIEAADDPWDVISKFIQTNILFGSSTTTTNNNNGDDDRIRSTSTSNGRSISGNNYISSKNNIWNSFPSSRINDVEEVDVESKLDTAEEPQQQQEQQLNDIIKEGWNQFIQNLGVLPNPFITQHDHKSDDASTSPQHQNLHTNTDSSHHRYDALTELIESVSSTGHHQYNNKNQLSIPDMIDLFWNTLQNVKKQLEGTFKSVLDLIVPIVNPLQLYYFMLEQEIIHNPVYKRRQHAYLTEVSVDTAVQISEGLYVSQLAYANDCITIQKYLKHFQNNSWILINCTTTSRPFEPAHFLAIRHSALEPNVTWNYPMENVGRSSNDASSTASTSWTTMLWENIRDALNLTNTDGSKNNKNMKLEAMLVICGTKDVADMMSDALLEPTQYGNSTHKGLVHSGIHQSALYIHNTYRDFFENLIVKTNRTMLKLWLIGHSLGGGTAALACLEFNKPYHATNISTSRNSNDTADNINIHNNQNNTIHSIDAYALGFGTPAVLSQEYSENARSKVTTIINDADCVPRMSGATLVNFLLNVTASNHWIKEAQIDVLHLKDIMKEKSPFPDIWVDTVMSTVYDWIATSDIVNDTMKAALSENIVEPVLFPPGECIHIYRDGTSWQSVYYPCRNFNALEGVRYMVDDHLIPTGYYRGLLGYIRASKNDMNWQLKPDLIEIPVSS